MQVEAVSGEGAHNHPDAVRMGWIAGISHNMIIGCLMGSFSVMLESVETRMGVTREMSSSVGALVIFGSALIGAIVGPMMSKYSLRLLLFAGAMLSVIGYLLLALTTSYPVYLGSYLLLLGPSMAIAGSIGPATLVTRWFSRNRGLALGLVHLSIVVAIMPLLSNWVLENYGAQAVYLMLAALVGLCLVPLTLAVRDYPPGADPQAMAKTRGADTTAGSLTVGQILRRPAFWALAIAAGAIITAIMVLTFNMIPIAESLGIDRGRGALLASIMSFSGMAGSILFGWVADRIGGARGIALLAFNFAVLMGLLQLQMPYPVLAVVMGLLGLHGAGMVPNVSRALAFSLGKDSFSRAFGLQAALSVPFTIVGIWAMGAAFTRTGSYSMALAAVAVLLLAVVPIALWAARKPAESRGADALIAV